MNFENYKISFREAAILEDFPEDYINRCLKYASSLVEKNIPIIYSLGHLSALLGISEQYIKAVAYSQDRYYRRFSILKKNGKEREICEPLPNLKAMQKWILSNILYSLPFSPYAKAFIPDRSIKDNARFHRSQPMVLSLDIKNFFPSISSILVFRFFKELGYAKKVCYYLTRICTLDGGLPQGAPTSPALSNLILKLTDGVLGDFCLQRKIRYTRYADDLTFSGRFVAGDVIKYVGGEMRKLDLFLNEEKTRLMRPNQRQEVTGIVVNEKIQVPRELRKELRKSVYYIRTFGIENHLARINEKRANYLNHLMGIANFILFINPSDKEARESMQFLHSEKENQNF